MLTWFKENYLQLDPDKFQFIWFHNGVESSDKSMKVGDTILQPLEYVLPILVEMLQYTKNLHLEGW
jgi:hypothetical protein